MVRHRLRPLLVWILVVAQLALGVGCQDSWSIDGSGGSGAPASTPSFDLGQMAFRVVRARVAAGASGAVRTSVLDANRTAFVDAVNATVPGAAVGGLLSAIPSVLPLVDDGTIPGMTDDVAEILEHLAADPAALQAVLDLAADQGAIPVHDLVDLAHHLLAFPAVDELFLGVADLVRDHDGVDDAGQPNGEMNLLDELLDLLATKLRGLSLGQGSTGAVGELLLTDARVRPGAGLGAPAWTVRLDGHGNPAVAEDPATGSLVDPFVDADGDGDADVDASRRPVDAAGNPIDIPPFAPSGTTSRPGIVRTPDGRARTPAGDPVYDYVDAKRTVLGSLLVVGGELVRRGALPRAVVVGDAVLGPTVTHDPGTPSDPSDDWEGYPDANPVTDLGWGGLELLREPTILRAAEAVRVLLENHPRRGEMVLVAAGRTIEALRGSSLDRRDLLRLVDELLPLLDSLLEVRQGASVGRLLVRVLDDLDATARDLPGELADLIRYRRLVRDANGVVDPVRSDPVDWSRDRAYLDGSGNLVDNRSDLEQLVDLLVTADGCSVPLTGKTLAELTIETMAGLSPATVDRLVQLVTSPLGGVSNLVCSGIAQDLQALDGLAASGALDALLPLARVVRDRNEVRTLIDLFRVVHRNRPAVRDLLPTLLEVLDAGAGTHVVRALQEAASVSLPGGGGTLVADALSDGAALLVDDDRTVRDRAGQPVDAPADLLLGPAAEIADRAGRDPAVRRDFHDLVFDVAELLIRRRTNDAGTPADPSDDFEELENPGVVPFLAAALAELDAALPADPVDRDARIDDLETALAEAVRGRVLALALAIDRVVVASPAHARMEDAVANLLRPGPAGDDPLGALLAIVAPLLQKTVDASALEELARFVGRTVDPSTGRVRELVAGTAAVLRHDRGRATVAVLRNAFDPSILGTGESPAEALLRIGLETWRAGGSGSGGAAAATPSDLGDALRQVVAFLRDDPDGLREIYRRIRNR